MSAPVDQQQTEPDVAEPDVAELDVSAQRIDLLLDRLAGLDGVAADLAESIVAELLSLYGAGLRRIVGRLAADDPAALRDLADDPLVAGLLVLHDLHPDGAGTTAESALRVGDHAPAASGGCCGGGADATDVGVPALIPAESLLVRPSGIL